MKAAILFVFSLPSILACTVTLTLSLNQVHRFHISQEQFIGNQAMICLQFLQFKEGSTYIARLDYLPYVGLQARNDKKMKKFGNIFVTSFQVEQLSYPLDDRQRPFAYQFVVEIRQSIIINSSQYLTFYKAQISQYLPACFLLVAIAFWTERTLWSRYKDKTD